MVMTDTSRHWTNISSVPQNNPNPFKFVIELQIFIITRTPNRSRRSGLLEWCSYDCRPIFKWSGVDSNPNKQFYSCPNYNTSGKRWCELLCEQILKMMNKLIN
ncbi:hypothetical protein Ahy_A06g030586 [Arachis hypogaea]|uniref:Zinc finger GRF-type domain-containing protein n=1 Tax=Arachis hypogaea TaxID=3818 RepID=A0A445CWQ8_ARAHY|nr:hypothetical protein Ahy_A06g030586 [Arachis hypogaea]